MPDLQALGIILVTALVTALTRFLPFLIFGGDKKVPKTVTKLGATLPFAVMGMLVIYCLKDISFESLAGFLPAFIACLIVAVLHIWKRNTLLSVIAGTLSYMALVQFVF